MSKFNTVKVKENKLNKSMVDNLAGGKGFSVPLAAEFAGIAFTSFVKDEYYRNQNDTIQRLYELIEKLPALFVAKTCWKTRHVYGLRSISHLITARLASTGKLSGVSWAKKFYESMIVRPDDMTEILALLDGKITHAMRKAFANVMENLNEYQLAKYAKFNSSGSGKINLNDVLRLSHAKFNKGDNDPLEKLMYRTLKNTETWEALGNSKETWIKLLSDNKLGYLALIRNLRNIAKYNDDKLTKLAYNELVNKESIKNGKIFPFQFLKAYQILNDESNKNNNATSYRKLIKGLNEACEISVSNIPKISGKTVILVDHSGSMENIKETANLFACALSKNMEDNIVIAFSSSHYWNNSGGQKFVTGIDETTILKRALELSHKEFMGGGTDWIGAFEFLDKNKITCDRLFILTDEQHWCTNTYSESAYTAFKKWCKSVKIDPQVWSVDLASYGTTQFPYEKTRVLYGFSEKIFDAIIDMEKDPSSFVEGINNIEFKTNKEMKRLNKVSVEVEVDVDDDEE